MNDLAIIEKQLTPLAPRFKAALPSGAMSVDRLIRTVMISVERTPKLLECSRESILSGAMSAAVLGLEVDGVTGQAFLVPFKGKAQLIIGYKGYSTIAARNGVTITGGVVRDGDLFEYELGSDAFVRHKPQLGGERQRKIIAAWATARANGRPAAVVVMSIDEIMAIKAKSPGAQRSDSPWNDPYVGFPAMAEKTAKRRLARSLPMSAFQLAARLDQSVEEEDKPAHIREDGAVIIEGQAEPAQPKPQPSAAQMLGRQEQQSGNDAASEPPASVPSAADTAYAEDDFAASIESAGTLEELQRVGNEIRASKLDATARGRLYAKHTARKAALTQARAA